MNATPNEITFSPAQLGEAAAKFRGPLLKVPYMSLDEQLKYLTLRLGITGKEIVGSINAKAQLHPYRRDAVQKSDIDVQLRVLETKFGTCNYPFAPNDVIKSIIGHRASQAKGDALKSTVSAQDVLTSVAGSIGEGLGYALWIGEENPEGTTTLDLFDGYDTIVRKEIKAGNISEAKGNLIRVPEITKVNAVDVFKKILYALHPVLRRTECFLFCSQEIADAYNEAYQMTHTGLVYNDKYDQVVVEGSGKRLIIVPVAEKAGSNIIEVCPKANMLFGCDQQSDKESINIGKYSPDSLMFEMRAFYGVQFESIDPRRMMVAVCGDDDELFGKAPEEADKSDVTDEPGND